jgi:hypothetical protein
MNFEKWGQSNLTKSTILAKVWNRLSPHTLWIVDGSHVGIRHGAFWHFFKLCIINIVCFVCIFIQVTFQIQLIVYLYVDLEIQILLCSFETGAHDMLNQSTQLF